MPKSQKLELKDRVFPTRIARLMCQRVYGHRISSEAWSNWKKWAGCPGRRMWLSADHVIALMAIAHVRSNNRFAELKRSEIDSALPNISRQFTQFIKELDEGLIMGRDVPDFVEQHTFKRPYNSLLYRKIPNFRMGSVYPKRLIMEALLA